MQLIKISILLFMIISSVAKAEMLIKLEMPDGEIKYYNAATTKSFSAGPFFCAPTYKQEESGEATKLICVMPDKDTMINYARICFHKKTESDNASIVSNETNKIPLILTTLKKKKYPEFKISFDCN